MEPKVNLAKSPRVGRGFSFPELKKAGIDIRVAKRKGIRVDRRRRTAHDENVKALKEGILGKKKPPKTAKKKASKPKKATTAPKKKTSKPKKATPPKK